jgi:hypothetical protein
MIEITHKLAEHLANVAAKYNATENGRSWFSDSDWDLAANVYACLSAVQKMNNPK